MTIENCSTFKELTRLHGRIEHLPFEDRAAAHSGLLSAVIEEMGEQVNYAEMNLFLSCLDARLEAFSDSWGFDDDQEN